MMPPLQWFPAYELDNGRFGFASEDKVWASPYGGPGDLLWVRETWLDNYAWCRESFGFIDSHEYPLHYKANSIHQDIAEKRGQKWKPSIHMPKTHARIWLKVTAVRVERLQDITHDDAIHEGVRTRFSNGEQIPVPVDQFKALWNEINMARGYGWDKNPWVWVVEFERTDRPYT